MLSNAPRTPENRADLLISATGLADGKMRSPLLLAVIAWRYWSRRAVLMLPVLLFSLGVLLSRGQESPAPTPPAPEPRRVRQPVHEYFTVFTPQSSGRQKIEQRVNPFLAYTHLGTDFGFIGTNLGQESIGWEGDIVCATLPEGEWGGMWHSLAGMGDDPDQMLDFRACYPSFILPKYQPRIVGYEMRTRGKGAIKLELKSAKQETLFTRLFPVDTPEMRTSMEPLDPEKIGSAKYLNWVAESGSDICIDSLSFIIQAPAISFDEYVFLASYAKQARCFSLNNFYMRDRAHIRDGYFDNVPASGLFALSTVIASRMGIVDAQFARELVSHINDNIAKLETAHGLLPHFVKRREDGQYSIHPGTEFSMIDTSIYYHSMLLAAEMLGDQVLQTKLTDAVKSITLDNGFVNADGFLRHGLREDKVTPLPAVWRDWGGESVLVLAMANMTANPPPLKMDNSGKIYDGTGFIAEVQSLFYPDFDSSLPDAMTGQNWQAIRQSMLSRQKEYFTKNWPDSNAAKEGFYGLSAGESRSGLGYMVSGVELKNQSIIHPHYLLMSACLEKSPDDVYATLRKMEEHQLFPPWGMAELCTKDVDEYLPMLSALNAGFECISAYHLYARHGVKKDEIYEASRKNSMLRKGISPFYPPAPASVVESKTGNPLIVR